MIGAILYRQIWNKLNLTRKLQDFQQAGKTRHDLAEAIFYMTVARSLMPDSGLAQWNKHNTFLYSGARLQLRHHLRALNELRNDLLEEQRDPGPVEDVLLKTIDAPSQKGRKAKRRDEAR